tara:strand:+ start:68 stop:1651 length:1584 start_codon:yes stop_codon:yes gene_type:complete
MRDFQLPGRSQVFSKSGMVATSHPVASLVGVSVLKNGGNAADAALAMALVLPICEPQSTGLFGDAFALIKPQGTDDIFGINGSGPTPKGFSEEEIREKGYKSMPKTEACSVTMPGAISAFELIAKNYSKLGLSEACQPAIKYAFDGIPVYPRVALDWSLDGRNLSGIARDLYLINGDVPKVGQVFAAPGQGEILKKISKEGSKGFYSGEVAEDFVNSLKNLGGKHELEDFQSVAAEFVNPISTEYRGYEVVELPPNGQGATALLMLRLLEKFNLSTMDPGGAERVHLEAEISKLAYSARDRFIADPKMINVDTEKFYADSFADELLNSIDIEVVNSSNLITNHNPHKDTVYLTAVDRDGMAVSLIFSVFDSFGTGLASEKYGVLFQNRGSGFTLEMGHPNEAKPGKRPLHTIIPGMVKKDGKFLMSFGVMGGQYQANGHARVISNIVDFDMDIQEALTFPRSFANEGVLQLERGYSEDTARVLSNLGHHIQRPEKPIGGGQIISIDNAMEVLVGASDPRKDGCALGL